MHYIRNFISYVSLIYILVKNNFPASWRSQKIEIDMKQLYSEISCVKSIIKGCLGAINQLLKCKERE